MLNLRVNLVGGRYTGVVPKARFVDDVIARIEAVPGVVAATMSSPAPIAGGWDGGGMVEAERRAASRAQVPDVRWNSVTAHWFRAFDVPILRGRDFTEAEGRDSSRVAIINRTMAERAWPSEDPLGRRFRLSGDTSRGWFTVIGLTPDVRGIRPATRQEPLIAFPYPYGTSSSLSITVRAAGEDLLRVVPAMRSAIREVDPDLSVFAIQTMEELRRRGYAETTVLGAVFSVFGLIALGLAAIGIYGMISYGVAQRTHEIGVRMALGARRGQVMRLFMGQGVGLALVGVAIGVPGALAITRVLRSMLFGVGPSDPLSFVTGTGSLIAAALAASCLPAWRAARVDPMRVLRGE
jgi:predicted permease